MTKPARVLQVGFTPNLGGIEALIMNIYKRINRQLVQFDFLAVDNDDIYYADEIKKLGGKIINVPSRRSDYIGRIRTFNQLMSSGTYDVIHVNCLSVADIDIIKCALKFKRTRVILHSHQDMKLRHWRSELLHRYNRWWLHDKNVIRLACSRKAATWIHGKAADSSIILPNGIDLSLYENPKSLRSQLGLENNYVIGCIGRFAYQKNYEFLLEIFKEIKTQRPEAKLLCIGDDGGMKNQILTLINMHKLNNDVLLTGIREDIPDLLKSMDVFVLPSRWEGLGIVYIEAQAAGLPCFASTAVPQEAKVTQLLQYLPLDITPSEWAKQILSSAPPQKRGEERLEEIRKAGYDINDVAKKLQKLYLSLL